MRGLRAATARIADAEAVDHGATPRRTRPRSRPDGAALDAFGVFRFRARFCLPRWVLAKYTETPSRCAPIARSGSPSGSGSTLITSAPWSAITWVIAGPGRNSDRSTTLMPSSFMAAIPAYHEGSRFSRKLARPSAASAEARLAAACTSRLDLLIGQFQAGVGEHQSPGAASGALQIGLDDRRRRLIERIIGAPDQSDPAAPPPASNGSPVMA